MKAQEEQLRRARAELGLGPVTLALLGPRPPALGFGVGGARQALSPSSSAEPAPPSVQV